MRPSIIIAAIVLASAPLYADSNLPPAPYANRQLDDPRQEARATALMEELRCLVCQGQSIADSNAELAGDMRSLVRERVAAGQSSADIRAYLIDRYGEWVTLRPPVEPLTWPLYAAPLVLLVLGAWTLRGRFRRRG